MIAVWLAFGGLALALALCAAYLLGEWRGSKHYYEPVMPATPPMEYTLTDTEPTLAQVDASDDVMVSALTDSITVVSVMDTTEAGELVEKAHELETELFLRDLEEETLNRQTVEEIRREMDEAETNDAHRREIEYESE